MRLAGDGRGAGGFRLPGAAFLARRMRSAGLLLGGVALAAFVTATAAAALLTFAVQALPRDAAGQLARLPGTWFGAIGLTDASTAASDTSFIRDQARGDLGGVPFQLDTAAWSAPLRLTTASGRTVAGAEVASAPQIAANAALTAGAWPAAPAPATTAPGATAGSGGGLVQVAVPAAVARQLAVTTGDVLAVTNSNTGARLRIQISGIYRQDDPAAPYWNLDAIWTCGASVLGCFTAGGPVVADPAALRGVAALAVDQASWVVAPDAARIPAAALAVTAAEVTATESHLQSDQELGGLVVSGSLPQNLTSVAAELTASRTALASTALLLLLPAAGALVLAARLLAAHREEEHALLLARSATRASLAVPALAEAVVVGGAAAVAGVLSGPRVAGLLTPSGRAGSGSFSLVPADWWVALIVVALCAVTLVWPVLRAPAPATVLARRGRQAALAGAAAAGADLALLALAAVGVWQLHGYVPAAGAGIGPVVVAAPALVLAAVSLVPLRLQPLLARALDRVAAATRSATRAMGAWEVGRLQVRRSAPVLLTVLAVATSTLAFASYASWRQSAQDQAAFTVGADVRVDAPWPVTPAQLSALTRAPGVTAATRAAIVPLASGGLLAVDAGTAPDTVLLRPDLAPMPEPALFGLLTTGGRPVPAIATTAFLQANSLKVGSTYPAAIGAASVTVRIVAVVSDFPLLPAAAGGGIVAGLGAVDGQLAAAGRPPLPVTSVWLRDGRAASAAPATGLPAPEGSVVTSRTDAAAGLLGDSLSALPQRAALATAAAVTLLAALGFAAAAAASLRERRGRRMLLKALGVSLAAQTWQLCGEELLLAVPAAAAGLLAGIGLAHLLMSVLVLTPSGAAPVPPVAVVVPLGWSALAAAAICVLPALVALAAGVRRDEPAAVLRGAEAT